MSFFKTKPNTAENSQPNSVRLHAEYALEYWKIRALFEGDPDFEVGEIDDANHACVITIKNPLKVVLLQNLIHLNALKVTIEAIDTPVGEDGIAMLFSTNPHFSRLYEAGPEDAEGTFFKAALFKPECMHYYSDDFFSPTGHTAILPQDLVRDLFGDAINIQTDLHD